MARPNAFAMVRPPGHHALPARGWVLLLHNVAIAAESPIRNHGLEARDDFIDRDLHHGNGTQEIFYDSAECAHASTHQFPHYPGTGRRGGWSTESASDTLKSTGRCLPNSATARYLATSQLNHLSIGRAFKPQFILYGGLRLSLARSRWGQAGDRRRFHPDDAAHQRLAAECCEGKVVAALEGGDTLEAIAKSSGAAE